MPVICNSTVSGQQLSGLDVFNNSDARGRLKTGDISIGMVGNLALGRSDIDWETAEQRLPNPMRASRSALPDSRRLYEGYLTRRKYRRSVSSK